MPAGFGNAAAYNLPTSFSGTFQQPFPGQAPFPQPPAYPQQPNGVCACVDIVDVVISVLITMPKFKLSCATDLNAEFILNDDVHCRWRISSLWPGQACCDSFWAGDGWTYGL